MSDAVEGAYIGSYSNVLQGTKSSVFSAQKVPAVEVLASGVPTLGLSQIPELCGGCFACFGSPSSQNHLQQMKSLQQVQLLHPMPLLHQSQRFSEQEEYITGSGFGSHIPLPPAPGSCEANEVPSSSSASAPKQAPAPKAAPRPKSVPAPKPTVALQPDATKKSAPAEKPAATEKPATAPAPQRSGSPERRLSASLCVICVVALPRAAGKHSLCMLAVSSVTVLK